MSIEGPAASLNHRLARVTPVITYHGWRELGR
jgi:hypothetical protein